jgi:hypothetical protein
MSFNKNKYTVIRKAISKDLATFIANYFSMKKQVLDTCRQARYISPYETLLGYYEEPDGQKADKMVLEMEDKWVILDLEELHQYIKKNKLTKVYVNDLISKLEWTIFIPKNE